MSHMNSNYKLSPKISVEWIMIFPFLFQHGDVFFSKACQLQISAFQGHLPSASAEIESCAATVVDLWHALKGVLGGEWSTLCSREIGGTGL